jgi:N-acetylglutamate synthase-like GNAT family acetyltransferase
VSPPVLRLATRDDIPALQALIGRSARGLSDGFYTGAEVESAMRHVFGVDSTLIADGTYFVAERDGAIVGCGGWSLRRTLYGGDQRRVGDPERLDPRREPARIRAFFVAPEAARQGVGRGLLARCEEEATRAGFTSLELMSTLPGVPFYTALGFAALEEVVDTMPDGVPLRFVHMRRSLA